MKAKRILTVDELRERREDVLTLTTYAKTHYLKAVLYSRLKSINSHLYTITKNPIYK